MNALLTAAIALIGIYIAFSLLTSWLNEQVATFIGLRSKTLVAGIRTMIGDTATSEFFDHPLISSLGERLSSGPGRNIKSAFELLSKFATIVGARYAQEPATHAVVQSSHGSRAATQRFPTYISSAAFAAVLTDIVRGHGTTATTSAPAGALGAAWTDLVAGLDAMEAIPELVPLRQSLMPIWREAQGDYDTFVGSVANWYDLRMDRVSGWYKRSVQFILLWIAVITVVSLNIDTLQVWGVFQTNVTVASAVAGLTQAYTAANSSDIASGKANLAKLHAPTQACSNATAANPTATCSCPPGFVFDAAAGACGADATTLTALPFGWGTANRDSFAHMVATTGIWNALFVKIGGLVITIAALMLGAPFWFDLLGSIVNVRSAGPLPPSTAKAS